MQLFQNSDSGTVVPLLSFRIFLEQLFAIHLQETSSKSTAQKMKFLIKDFFSKCADLVTFTEEIFNGKLHFLCIEVEERQKNLKREVFLEKSADSILFMKRCPVICMIYIFYYIHE